MGQIALQSSPLAARATFQPSDSYALAVPPLSLNKKTNPYGQPLQSQFEIQLPDINATKPAPHHLKIRQQGLDMSPIALKVNPTDAPEVVPGAQSPDKASHRNNLIRIAKSEFTVAGIQAEQLFAENVDLDAMQSSASEAAASVTEFLIMSLCHHLQLPQLEQGAALLGPASVHLAQVLTHGIPQKTLDQGICTPLLTESFVLGISLLTESFVLEYPY
jgi:hypothetical protein